jgi:hypothetical protein
MWQTHYDSSPHANFTFKYSIIGNFDISHIAHINYHHPTNLGEHGLIKINDSPTLDIFYKHGGGDHNLYQ